MDIFLVKNLYDYEIVISPPKNLPNNMITYYVTDNENNANKAKMLGWDYVHVTTLFLDVIDKFDRRKSAAYINCFPHEFIDKNIQYDLIFVCDSNIVSLWNNYSDFVSSCHSNFDKTLFLTNGYYDGDRNTITMEISHSNQSRWSYNYDSIVFNGNKYVKHLNDLNVNIPNLGVCSAKYIGWNPSHKNYKTITNKLYEEYTKHLQGNIILTYLSGLYKNDTFVYYSTNYNGGRLNNHKYSA
jgi:hypothetical protein